MDALSGIKSLLGALATGVITLFMIAVMISIGLEVRVGESLSALRSKSLVIGALIANFVCVPLLGIVIARVVPMPQDIETGFLLVAAAPGALFAINFTRQMRGSVPVAAALLILLTGLSILITPPLAELMLRVDTPVTMHYDRVIKVVLVYVLLPLLAGVALRNWNSSLATALTKPMNFAATVLFVLGVVFTMSVKSAASKRVGLNGLVAMVLLIVGSMIIGWVFGGPEIGNRRVLTLNTGMRNVALCLAIASRSFPGTDVEVAALAFNALMIPPCAVFTIFQSRKIRKQSLSAAQARTVEKDAA